MGVSPSLIGLFWNEVLFSESLPSLSLHNQVQPLPKVARAFAVNCSLNASKLVNVVEIAFASSPVGSPPPCGDIICRKRLWLRYPHPLFLTAIRLSAGSSSKCVNMYSID